MIGINENQELPDFQIFPCPAQDEFDLVINMLTGKYVARIYNELGQLVKTEDFAVDYVPYRKEFHLKGLRKGIYYIELTYSEMQRVKKILLF